MSVCSTAPIGTEIAASTRSRGASSKRCEVSALTSATHAAWDDYVRGHPDGTLFHTIAWRNAVSTSFGHAEHYLVARRDGSVVGVLPMFLVKSLLAGRMLVSVPYGVGGGIVADDVRTTVALFDAAKTLADDQQCRMIDFRSERAVVPDLPVNDQYVGFRGTLPDSPGEVLRGLPRKARAAARKARDRHGLRVAYGDEHLAVVWQLYARSMRRIASINYPYHFFAGLIRELPGAHWTVLVIRAGKPVAGLVAFIYKDTIMPYFVGMADTARECSAANYVYLSIMERAVEHGYGVFDFGRSRRGNRGCVDFKRFHGFVARPLKYQRYVLPGMTPPDLSPTNPKYMWARHLWPHLPLPLTRALGASLSKQIPG